MSTTLIKPLLIATLSMMALLALTQPADALKCSRPSFLEQVQNYDHVVVARVVKTSRKVATIEVLKLLKAKGKLFANNAKTFKLEAWKYFDPRAYKKGEIRLFFFHRSFGIKCNLSILLAPKR